MDGQEQTRLHAGQDPILAICSSPVSDVVYALRDRDGSGELVRIPMRGDANSAAVLLTGLPFSGNIARRCTVSADGRRLLYMRAASHANLWRLDLARAVAATKLTQGTRLFAHAKVSPDGQWIASSMGPKSGYPSNTDNWATQSGLVKIPIGGGEPVGLGEGSRLAWSTNGQRVAFVSRRSGSLRVWIARTDVVGPEEVKDSAVSAQLPPIWLPDGRLAWPTPDHQNYRIRDLRTGEDEYLFKGDSFGWVFNPQFSPRGDYVALSWNRIKEPRGQDVWVLSWPGRAERRLTKGMLMPIGWSADGEWIYATGVATVFRVSFQTGKTEPVAQFPVETVGSSCDLFPDRSAVICSLLEQKSDAWIVENFDPEIR